MSEQERPDWPTAPGIFCFGENVRSIDPSRPWRGFVVGWYKTPSASGYCVENAFEYNHVMPFDSKLLEKWTPRDA